MVRKHVAFETRHFTLYMLDYNLLISTLNIIPRFIREINNRRLFLRMYNIKYVMTHVVTILVKFKRICSVFVLCRILCTPKKKLLIFVTKLYEYIDGSD